MSATVADTLVTKYALDPSDYTRGANKVKKDTKDTGDAMDKSKSQLNSWNKGVSEISGIWSAAAGTVTAFVGALTAAAAAIAAMGIQASKQAAEFDALIQALAAVEGGLTNAKQSYKELFEIARAPGIGPEEALKGYLLLRRSGLDKSLSEKIITETGNVNATGGGGKAELDRLLLVMSQIANKPFLQGEELMQFAEAGVPVNQQLKAHFGTNDTDELKRKGIDSLTVIRALVEEWAKFPRVGNTAKNSIENLETAFQQLTVGIGVGINSDLMPWTDQLTAAFEKITESGIAQLFGETLVSQFDSLTEALMGGAGLDSALIEVGAVVVTVSAAIRNFALNIKSIKDAIPKWMWGPLLPGASEGMTPQSEGQNFSDEAKKRLELFDRKKAKQGKKGGAAGDLAMPEAPKTVSNPAVDYLRQIAQNTSPIPDMKRMALGGGDLGAQGISSIDLSGMRRGGAGNDPARHMAIAFGLMFNAGSVSRSRRMTQ